LAEIVLPAALFVKAPCHVDISFQHARVEFDNKLVLDDQTILL